MELRKRRRQHRARRSNGAARAGTIGAFALLFALAGAIGFSRLGTRLSRDVVAPAILRARGQDGRTEHTAQGEENAPAQYATVAPEAEVETSRVVAPAYTLYALQIGSFESEENAIKQAQSLREVGAAGYVLKDGARYRVLAAGYNAKADCESVQTRLIAQGMDSLPVTLSYDERAFKLESTSDARGVLEASLQKAASLPDAAYQACIAFDREQQSLEQGAMRIKSIQSDANRAHDELAAYDSGSGVAELARYYRDVAALCADALTMQESAIAFSSALKRLYLETACAYGAFLAGTAA